MPDQEVNVYLFLQRLIGGAAEWAIMLAPIMIYLLVLGMVVNRRSRPVPVSGPWNMLGLLLALSGFLLFGPLSWLSHFFQPKGEFSWAVYLAYLSLLGVVSLVLLRFQANSLVIYNIEPEIFNEVLSETIEQSELQTSRNADQVTFSDSGAILNIEAMQIMHNVTVRWRGPAFPERPAFEKSLRRKLAETMCGYNPSASILTVIAGTLFVFVMFSLALYLAFNFPNLWADQA